MFKSKGDHYTDTKNISLLYIYIGIVYTLSDWLVGKEGEGGLGPVNHDTFLDSSEPELKVFLPTQSMHFKAWMEINREM